MLCSVLSRRSESPSAAAMTSVAYIGPDEGGDVGDAAALGVAGAARRRERCRG